MTREEFETADYITFQNEMLVHMVEAHKQDRKNYLNKVSLGITRIISEIKKLQNRLVCPIKCIQLSLMRYSILGGCPIIRIDAYGEGGILAGELITGEINISWPSIGLKELKEKLLLEEQKDNCLYAADVDVLLSKTVDLIEYYFRETLRYEWKLVEEIVILQEIDKTDDFYVSVGEYMDKQEYMYVERSAIDIFFNEKKETLIYRTYKDAIYRDKQFNKLELEGARFINCVFDRTVWKYCSLIDCTFENCSFEKSRFEESDMRGCVFVRCTFYKIEHFKIDANAHSGKMNNPG